MYAFMNRLLLLTIFSLFLGCASQKKNVCTGSQLYQYGVIDGLLAGAMDGNLTIKQLKQHGNFGIGTFNSADGEMFVLDNDVHRVRYSGEIVKVPEADSTPFAAVTNFVADTSFVIEAISYANLQLNLKPLLNNNCIYAIKITGSFNSIVARAVAPGVKPYPTLKEVIESSQRLFTYNQLHATAIGFLSPDYL
jgi:acetolactate decarboxylase